MKISSRGQGRTAGVLPEGFRHFVSSMPVVSSMPAPVASGWSDVAGWASHHWKAPPCHGAPPKGTLASRSGNGVVGVKSCQSRQVEAEKISHGDIATDEPIR